MMDNIPIEILILIFKHLHLEQKLECILVCRKWAQVLRQGYLFETMVFSPYGQLKYFFQYLDSSKRRGLFPMMKCKRLVLDQGLQYSTNIATLATSFPNLTFFYSKSPMNIKSSRSTALNSDPLIGWRSNLKTLIYASGGECSHLHLLNTGIFSCLTTLKMHPFSADVIPRLKNTPALNKLSISIHDLTLNHLEDLHAIVPGLTSLTLKGNPLPYNSNEMLPKIVPAEKIKELQLDRTNGIDSFIFSDAFSLFIKSKYTRLNEFSCGITDEDKWCTISTIFSDANFADFITTTGTGLSKCMISLRGASTETVNLFEEHMVQLEVLGIDIFGCNDIFEKAESGRESQNTTTVPPSGQLQDLKSIELKKFTHLKELILDFSYLSYESVRYYQTTFKKIVDKLPRTIQTLGLKKFHITFGQEKETMQACTRIQNLKLYHVVMSGETISTSFAHIFPKLKSLVLDSCNFVNSASFNLPNHHLQCFKYFPARQDYRRILNNPESMKRLKITVAGQTFYYRILKYRGGGLHFIMNAEDHSIQRVLKAFPDIDEYAGVFHFEFASVQTTLFSDFLLII